MGTETGGGAAPGAGRGFGPSADGQEHGTEARGGFGPPGSGPSVGAGLPVTGTPGSSQAGFRPPEFGPPGFGPPEFGPSPETGGQASSAAWPPPATAWQPPSEVERGLYEAKTRQDWAAYFDVLAGAYLYHPMPRADADQGLVVHTPYWNPQVGAHTLGFFTHGVLPAPVADTVYFRRSLGRLAEEWYDDRLWLSVNPGTPSEACFPATAAHRALWTRHAESVPLQPAGALRTLRVGGPLQGEVAHGLACGALLCVSNGSLWNAMAWHGTGYRGERERLRDWWDITTREQWQQTVETLLRGRAISPPWEFVLGVRRTLAREYGGPVEAGHWREVTARVLRARAAEAGFGGDGPGEGDGGSDGDGPGGDGPDVEAEIRRVGQLIGRITRYEARFRADGLLRGNRSVRSVLAWDFGRASKMARWGLGARFCDMREAESAVVRASRVSRIEYHSWEDFSAGYILGRCLHFDEEEFGPWYEEMLQAHRILTADPESPWLTIPW
ncbi:DUF1266 domain-containing protein [Streptomyces sp. URMC 126]|uniref:DUF1266 domain-containing protein n=1 Tax=Streptomyces sp. URMC 126 TaxID=3423401 RepID=UPI003F1B9C57